MTHDERGKMRPGWGLDPINICFWVGNPGIIHSMALVCYFYTVCRHLASGKLEDGAFLMPGSEAKSPSFAI
jgi:hypothetical protein